jgi:predicted membrane channel-forming protein YqfA (hemolysin III family)
LAVLEIEIDNKTVSHIIFIIDVLSMLAVFLFSRILHTMLEDYSQQFDEEVIQCKDFSLVIRKLPESYRKFKNQNEVTIHLWN